MRRKKELSFLLLLFLILLIGFVGVISAIEPECVEDYECDDGSYCNGVEICEGGLCGDGDIVNCDDKVDCTDDMCDEVNDECVNEPRDDWCSFIECGYYTCEPENEGANDAGCIFNTEETEPDTKTVFATRDNGTDREECEDGWMYINFDEDDIVINFESEDMCTNLKQVEYVRTGWNGYWKSGDGFIGMNEEKEDEWYTDSDDLWLDEEYKVCGRAKDMLLNQESDDLSVEEVDEDDCCMLCIDREDPEQVTNIVHENPGECVSNYINEAPEFSWEEPNDEPECSGVDYYEVEFYLSDGTLVYTYETEENNFIVPQQDLVNGQDYYIKVRAVDKAENKGDWSIESTHVWYDNENPEVEIISPDQGDWFNDDFEVEETDDDNLGLWKCEYKIENNAETIVDWTEITCNSLLSVDVSEVCPEDGDCVVYKKAIDKACNEDDTSKDYYIDTTPPVTEKTISDPKYPGFEWMTWLVDWFITDETTIEFDCTDQGIGCGTTYYTVNQGVLQEYVEAISFENDGIYEIEFYSVDLLENTEETQYEIDKVDTEAPETTKQYVGDVFWGLRYLEIFDLDVLMRYITSETQIILTAQDEEVGVEETWWTLFVPSEQGQLEEWYGLDADLWYESLEDCEEENEECFLTTWEQKAWYMEQVCEDNEGWCLYEEPISILQDCDHKICYFSEDYLENTEEMSCQVFSIDNEGPEITVHNPSIFETEVERCAQSIVASISDDKTGIEEAWAELWTDPEEGEPEQVEYVELKKELGEYWDALMSKEHPVGDYILKVCAEDKLGNENCEEIEETLLETVFVEYISPALCNIDPEQGGECDFTFHVCMRGDNSIKFWMNKLGGIITPGMMNARISHEDNEAFVGLKHEGFESEAELLQLDCEEINEQTWFDLHLELDSEVVSQIGPGIHDLEYWINSYLEECEEEPVYECEQGETRDCYTGPLDTSGVGECSSGTESCVEGYWSGICEGEIIPIVEICDNELDDDCDSYTDCDDYDDCYLDDYCILD